MIWGEKYCPFFVILLFFLVIPISAVNGDLQNVSPVNTPLSQFSDSSIRINESPQIFTLFPSQKNPVSNQANVNISSCNIPANVSFVQPESSQNMSLLSPQIPAVKPDLILPLTIGWNFISIPFPLHSGNDTAEIFRGINSIGHSMYRYDSVSGWVKVRNSDYLVPMEGFWIFSSAPAQIPLFYKEKLSISSTARNLQTGWNTIGISSGSPQTIRNTFQSISDKWMFLIPFNTTIQRNSDPSINGWNGTFGDQYALEPGKGYWLYMKSPGTFVCSASSQDITFSGKVGYKVTEQGWTITLPGTITGVLSPDSGNLQIFSNDAVIKYSGKSYPISMDIDASIKN